MTQIADHSCDVFVAYSLGERAWVQDKLVPGLLTAGLNILADHRDSALGAARPGSDESPIWRSRSVLLVLSSHTSGDQRAHFEALLEQLAHRAGRKPQILAALLEPCELAGKLALLKPIDFTSPAGHARQMRRLLRKFGHKRQVFIAYQRGADPDSALAGQLAACLERSGHQIARGQELLADAEWVAAARREIAASDYIVVLLSAASVQSELVASEVEHAHQEFLEHGRPRILPVRVDYQEPLPYQIGMYLDRLLCADWRGRADTRRLTVQLCDAIGHRAALPTAPPAMRQAPSHVQTIQPPAAYADPRFVEALDVPGGAIRPDSAAYVERGADAKMRRMLRSPRGVTTTIRAPRQSGKSSLLLRGLAQIQAQEGKTIFVDLQPVDRVFLQSLDAFLRYVATIIVDKLRLDQHEVDALWSSPLGSTNKLTNLLENYILPRVDTKVTLAIDEADRLLNTESSDVFFGLLRLWHNNRARNQIWDKLDLLMVIATEPYLLMRDLNQSPFNVGETIDLEDFDADEVADLNLRYLSPLGQRDLPDLLALLGGHPYLTARALYAMRADGLTWAGLRRVAASDRGPFGDHLRHYLWLLHDQIELRGAIKQIIDRGICSDERLFFRLVQAGLAKGVDASSCALRCALYEAYFGGKLR